MKRVVVLLSGGLDSATIMAIAKKEQYKIYAISFDYGQRHKIELDSAKKIAGRFGAVEHKIAKIDLRLFGGSALTDEIVVPKNQLVTDYVDGKKIPITYVPARNAIFLAYALGYAEVIGADDIFIGVNAVDYSGYPDCRIEFIKAFETMANLATAVGAGGGKINIRTPLINLSKKEIIKMGIDLGVDYSIAHSCYDPVIFYKTRQSLLQKMKNNFSDKTKVYACGKCDSCLIRLNGFEKNNMKDPYLYSK